MAATNVILLERIDNLGAMGETVTVKPGFARNYLLPQGKALRATKENIAYFDAQKAALEAENEKRRKEAEKDAKKIEGLNVAMIRQASEGGQLYGSVTARDIAEAISDAAGIKISRKMVDLNQNMKTIGLFNIPVALHPEVKVEVTINVARTMDEAEIQAETGKALVAGEEESLEEAKAEAKEAVMEQAEELFEEVPETFEEEVAEAEAVLEEASSEEVAQDEAETETK
jgi:large subunit ribosomal protein L9